MIVRRERYDDAAAVRAVHSAAFPAAPGEPSPEARLVDALRADGDAVTRLSFVAVHEGVVVGHVQSSRGHVEGRPLLALGPVGVVPQHQRRGIGQALLHGAVAAADAVDEPAVVLLGDPGYYRRFGFLPARSLGLLPPDAGWGEHFQVRVLTAWDPVYRGVFRYARAFDALDAPAEGGPAT